MATSERGNRKDCRLTCLPPEQLFIERGLGRHAQQCLLGLSNIGIVCLLSRCVCHCPYAVSILPSNLPVLISEIFALMHALCVVC